MSWSTRPSAPAGGRLTTELLDAMNDQIELLSTRECVLLSDHAGVASNTTLGSAGTTTNLARPVLANKRYRARCFFWYSASTTGDFKPSVSLPSGSFIRYSLFSMLSSNDSSSGPVYFGSATTAGTLTAPGQTTATDIISCQAEFYVSIGSTAGNLTVIYAQAASSATATIVRAGSTLRIDEVDGV
jgi:hypothetical protein